jgi:hypothetical protein
MLDFAPIRDRQTSMSKLVAGLGPADLRRLTNEMIDTMQALIADCVDADVTFVPRDPDAEDPYAENPADRNLAWTLGHVVVHVTASAEESAFLAAELARGVAHHGRSRFEVPWESVTTIAQCRHRLEESRRMRLATLDVWPDEPHLNNSYEGFGGRSIGPVARFVYGLMHDDDHLGQLEEIVRQANADRSQ